MLVATDPSNGAVLSEAPEKVTLTFNESVEVSLGAVRVFDHTSRRVDGGVVRRSGGNPATVEVDLIPTGPGTYLVAWHVVSADSHPVQGSFVYRVSGGDTREGVVTPTALSALERTGRAAAAAQFATRLGAYVFAVLLVGPLGLVVLLWPEGRRSRRASRIAWTGWSGSVATSLAAIVAQGAYAGGVSFVTAASPEVVRSVLSTRFGTAAALRIGALALLAVPMVRLFRPAQTAKPPALSDEGDSAGNAAAEPARTHTPKPDEPHVGPDAVLATSPKSSPLTGQPVLTTRLRLGVTLSTAAFLTTFPPTGHAGARRPVVVSVALDAVHIVAASLWLGGIVVLLACVMTSEGRVFERVVRRFSTLAMVCVVAIVGTGVLQAFAQTGSMEAIRTPYGGLLIAKVVAVVALLGAGYLSRSWVRSLATARKRGESDPDKRELRSNLLAELGLAVVVLAITTGLASSQPGRAAVSRPFSATLQAKDYSLTVLVDPGRKGRNTLHLISVRPDGREHRVEEMRARISMPAKGIGALEVDLQRAGEGHFIAPDLEVPLEGEWQLYVVSRTGEFDADQLLVVVPVR